MEKCFFKIVGRESQFLSNFLLDVFREIIMIVKYILFALKLENLFYLCLIFRTGIPIGKIYRGLQSPEFLQRLIQLHFNFIVSHILFRNPHMCNF